MLNSLSGLSVFWRLKCQTFVVLLYQVVLFLGCSAQSVFAAVVSSVLRASLLAGWFMYHLFKLGQQPTARGSLWTHTGRLRL